MITTKHQDILATWLCQRIGLAPSPDLRCIGNTSSDGTRLLGVVGYDGYNGASVVMHSAGEGPWVSRAMLYATFDYPFNRLKCNMVLALVPSGNKAALRFNKHIGFTIENELRDAHPDGSLILMTMRKFECRFLESRYGQEVRTAART